MYKGASKLTDYFVGWNKFVIISSVNDWMDSTLIWKTAMLFILNNILEKKTGIPLSKVIQWENFVHF